MSERGVFAVDRGMFDHDCFAQEPFTEREAWLWLIGAASWKARTVRIGDHIINVKRGQGAFSMRFLAERFQWSKSRVHRYLDRLKKRDMIETESGTAVNVITICKYDTYQRVSLPTGTGGGTQSGTGAGQERDKEEYIKDIEEEKVSSDWPKDFREVFWTEYPKRVGKIGALKVLESIHKRGAVPWAKLIDAVRAYKSAADPKFTKDPQTWLNKGCWDDEIATRATPIATGAVLKATAPEWNLWKAFYRDAGNNSRAALMDKFAAEDRAMTFPTLLPQ